MTTSELAVVRLVADSLTSREVAEDTAPAERISRSASEPVMRLAQAASTSSATAAIPAAVGW